MKIYLDDPTQFTIENLKKLIASEDDSTNTQFRVTRDGYLFLSKEVYPVELDNILFRLESFQAGNGYVGKEASEDNIWVQRLFNVIQKNWDEPAEEYIDNFY